MAPLAPGNIAILEDDGPRIAAMRSSLSEMIPVSTPIVITDNAHTMLAWLREHLQETALISLDHDLPLRSDRDGIDHGDGRMVADYLATLAPTCPVIVHSSNDLCATGMFYALKHAGWPVSRVVPYDGEDWIHGSWAQQIQKLIERRWLNLDLCRNRPRRA
jgi:hypothetical protein